MSAHSGSQAHSTDLRRSCAPRHIGPTWDILSHQNRRAHVNYTRTSIDPPFCPKQGSRSAQPTEITALIDVPSAPPAENPGPKPDREDSGPMELSVSRARHSVDPRRPAGILVLLTRRAFFFAGRDSMNGQKGFFRGAIMNGNR